MRRRGFLAETVNRVTFGAIASVIVNPFTVGDLIVASYSNAAPCPTPIEAESSVSRSRTKNGYLMTYDWTDRPKRRWRLKLSINRSAYTAATQRSYGYLSAFEAAKTNRHAGRLTERFATADPPLRGARLGRSLKPLVSNARSD